MGRRDYVPPWDHGGCGVSVVDGERHRDRAQRYGASCEEAVVEAGQADDGTAREVAGGSGGGEHGGEQGHAAVVIGAATAWIADGATGALPGHYPALAGIAALFSLGVSTRTAALARIAPPGVALAGLTFIVVGVPATGGPVGLAQFLPAFFRFLNPALPASVTIPAMTNVVYFDGHAIGQDLWVLTAWAVGGLLALLAASRFRVQRSPGVATSR